MASQSGTVALALGILTGIAGFFLISYTVCTLPLGALCLEAVRPYETTGLLLMGLGGVLFIVGIILIALQSRAAAPGPPQPASSPASPGKYCSKCGTLNASEAQFCNSCGERFPDVTS